jgi:predicted PurR-regulated permease PerM
MIMEYEVVFDILDTGYRFWWFPAGGLLFVLIGIILVKFRKIIAPRIPRIFISIFVFFWLSFACLWTVVTFAMTFSDFLTLQNAMQNNLADFVEGTVTNFSPMPYSGHVDESFEVNGHKFSFSDFAITAGFNNTKSHGGPIDEGVHVRIWYIKNKIARLEIAKK